MPKKVERGEIGGSSASVFFAPTCSVDLPISEEPIITSSPSSSSDKAETIAEKLKREWEEQKVVFHAEWKNMVEREEKEERHQASKVTEEDAARIREEEDAKG
ncbi:hypothetical protein RHMOL_Rhmol01G0086100 [Rhododendron molle]|uniref:Uncharacterized protein n=1 Tax=Rhododendron molle TaxID=49168 RepID=A0ACC0PZB1_RHOML|nr:hypothetical protein RHMOL_Rhmol01G0086100 [Rhododendron molle]